MTRNLNATKTEYRKASDNDFPYTLTTVPFIKIKGREVRWAQDAHGKRQLLRERGGTILAVWPGRWNSDVFLVDDREAALAALGPERSGIYQDRP